MIGFLHFSQAFNPNVVTFIYYKMLNHLDGIPKNPKGLWQSADRNHYRFATVEANTLMTPQPRKPQKNTAFSVHFIIKGAEKRRTMAYAKAKMLQNELGVTPHLVSVK